jgi:hypothetical protein
MRRPAKWKSRFQLAKLPRSVSHVSFVFFGQGTIRFVGKASALPAGFWVGVELDEGWFGFVFLRCSWLKHNGRM